MKTYKVTATVSVDDHITEHDIWTEIQAGVGRIGQTGNVKDLLVEVAPNPEPHEEPELTRTLDTLKAEAEADVAAEAAVETEPKTEEQGHGE